MPVLPRIPLKNHPVFKSLLLQLQIWKKQIVTAQNPKVSILFVQICTENAVHVIVFIDLIPRTVHPTLEQSEVFFYIKRIKKPPI